MVEKQYKSFANMKCRENLCTNDNQNPDYGKSKLITDVINYQYVYDHKALTEHK